MYHMIGVHDTYELDVAMVDQDEVRAQTVM
jgi:hypothetical protein